MTNSAKEANARLPILNFQRQIGKTEDDFLRSNAVAMNIAPAWKHFYKLRPGLGYDIPSKTRGLYRCLLRESARFQEREVQMFLRNTISERFHFHHRETSIPRSLKAIHEAEKSLTIIRAALSGDSHYYNKLVDLGMGRIGPLAFVRDKIKRISNPSKRFVASLDVRPQSVKHRNPATRFPMPSHVINITPPKPKQVRAAKIRPRKPFQTAFKVESSSGRVFMRVRGWVQPAKTSMMVKNSVKAVQRRLDRFQTHQEYLQMLDGEALFLKTCGVNTDDVRGAAQHVRKAVADSRKIHLKKRSSMDDDNDALMDAESINNRR